MKKEKEDEQQEIQEAAALTEKANSKIETTEEELEGFLIIKSILRQKIDVSRVAYRDAQTYFAILLDDNNRKTICRLYLDDNKKEVKKEIQSLDDLFTHSNELLEVLNRYEDHDS